MSSQRSTISYSYRRRRRKNRGMARLGRLVVVVGLLVAMVAIGWAGWQVVKAHTAPALAPQPTFDTLAAQQQLQQVANQHPELVLGVELRDLQSGASATVNATRLFTAASTTKLITAVMFLHQVERGQQSMSEMVGSYQAQFQLKQLINQSNNDSWEAFLDLLGRQEEEAYAHQLGLSSYQSATNQIDADDLATLLQKLWTGKLLNATDTQLLLSYMQNTNEERLLPPAIPSDMQLYHKYGELDDNVHDVGIVVWQNHPYAMVIMSNGQGTQDYDHRIEVFHQLAGVMVGAVEGEEAGK